MASKRSSKKKKIKSHNLQEKAEKKSKKMTLYMSIFISFLMITSVFAVVFYGYTSESDSLRYGKHRFRLTELGYELRFERNNYYFEILPNQVEDLIIGKDVNKLLKNSEAIIITSDPDSYYIQDIALATYHINEFMLNHEKPVGVGFTKENEFSHIITCDNSTIYYPVIEIKESEDSFTKLEGNCIIIGFSSAYDLKAITSRMLYDYLGVFDEKK